MKPTSTTTAAADLTIYCRRCTDSCHGINEEGYDFKVGTEKECQFWAHKELREAQQTDTLSGLRTKIEEIYTPDADFKDQVLELLGEKKGCIWEPLEGVGKLWCVIHDTDHGAG